MPLSAGRTENAVAGFPKELSDGVNDVELYERRAIRRD